MVFLILESFCYRLDLWCDISVIEIGFVVICSEVYAVSIVGPFPTAVTSLLDLTRL